MPSSPSPVQPLLATPVADPQACRDLYPFFQTSEQAGGKRGCVLAAHNVRRWLRQVRPDVKFSVVTDKYSMGNCVRVSWTAWPDTAPLDSQQLQATLSMFRYGTYDGMTDGYDYDRDPGREAFRTLFGSAKSLQVSKNTPTPKEIAEREQATLDQTLRDAPASARRGPRL